MEDNVEQLEHDIAVSVDTNQLAGVEWNGELEKYFTQKLDMYIANSVKYQRRARAFYIIHVSILIPVMLLSYVFGSSGVALSIPESAANRTFTTIQSYVLLGIGVSTMFLKLCKFEKRALRNKQIHHEYTAMQQKISLQMCLPPTKRKSPDTLLSWLQSREKVLRNKQIF